MSYPVIHDLSVHHRLNHFSKRMLKLHQRHQFVNLNWRGNNGAICITIKESTIPFLFLNLSIFFVHWLFWQFLFFYFLFLNGKCINQFLILLFYQQNLSWYLQSFWIALRVEEPTYIASGCACCWCRCVVTDLQAFYFWSLSISSLFPFKI